MSPPLSQQAWIAHLRAQLPVAIQGEDPEGLHQVRVAAQRLRVWLQLGGRAEGEPRLRRLRRRLSRARDLDVLLLRVEHPGLSSWLRSEREQEQARILPVLRDPRLSELLDRLEGLPPVERAAAERARRHLHRRALERAARVEAGARAREDLHRLRRAVRRLRYAQELLDEDASRAKALQSALGQVNDAWVALDLVATYPDPPAIAAWVAQERRRLEALQRTLALGPFIRPG